LLAWLALAAPTYRDVAPVLARKCCGCHHPGAAAPMALGSYTEAAAWSETVREAVTGRRMPPWGADPAFGRWANDRSLSAAERELLLAWIAGGCREGDPIRGESPPPTGGWRIKPDVVLTMPRDEVIPAAGSIPYRFVEVPSAFEDDVWVQAAEVRPGNRKAVHHVLVFAPLQGNVIAIDNGILASYLPGDDPLVLPPGYAKRIPGGMPLTFQLHYTATGRPETDRTSIGLVFAKKPPAREVRTLSVENQAIGIPPGAPNYEIAASREVDEPAELLCLTPHMHLRGKDFSYAVARPGEKAEMLLSVPRYDFNWQIGYRFREPVVLPAGSRIECVAHYDNSAANPNNPDPSARVGRGEMTDEEMMLGLVDIATPRKVREAPVPPAPPTGEPPVDRDSVVAICRFGGGLLCGAVAVGLLRRRRPAR
jgi:hypothetical protein